MMVKAKDFVLTGARDQAFSDWSTWTLGASASNTNTTPIQKHSDSKETTPQKLNFQ